MSRQSIHLRRFRVLFALILVTTAAWAEDPSYSFEPSNLGYLLKTADGRPVFQYMNQVPAGDVLDCESACCLYPYYTPDGVQVGDIGPVDHEHHRGIFFGFVSVSHKSARADFWGWGQWAPRIGRRIENVSVELVSASKDDAVVRVVNTWINGTRQWFSEETEYAVHEGDGFFVFDCRYQFTAKLELTIDQKAFGGLGIRMRSDGEASVHDANGLLALPNTKFNDPTLNWPDPWYRYELKATNGEAFAVTGVSHPSNDPQATWFKLNKNGMLSPSISALQEVDMKPEDKLDLRFRIIVQDETANPEAVQKSIQSYLETRFD